MGRQGGFSELEPLPPETGNWTEENGAANCLAYYQQYEQEGKPVQKSSFFQEACHVPNHAPNLSQCILQTSASFLESMLQIGKLRQPKICFPSFCVPCFTLTSVGVAEFTAS